MADKPAQIKCVIWDLDGTVWAGTLSEGGAGELRPGVLDTIRELDRRGIIQSVASKNDGPSGWRLSVLRTISCAPRFPGAPSLPRCTRSSPP